MFSITPINKASFKQQMWKAAALPVVALLLGTELRGHLEGDQGNPAYPIILLTLHSLTYTIITTYNVH